MAMFSAQAHMLLIDVCFTRTVRLKLDRLLMTAALLLLAALFGLTCAEMCALTSHRTIYALFRSLSYSAASNETK